MRLHYLLPLLSCCLLSACGDKTKDQAASPEIVPNTTTAVTTTPTTPNPNTATASNNSPTITEPPAIAGSGCPDGSAQIEFQPKQASFKLNLAELVVGTGQGQKTNITCNLAVPVTVPSGYQVSILPLHFAGNLTGNGLQIEVRREYFFAGTTGIPQVSALALPANSQFALSDAVNADDTLQWSNCGQDTNIRVNTRILVKGGEGQAKLKISSTDTVQADLFKLNYRACN